MRLGNLNKPPRKGKTGAEIVRGILTKPDPELTKALKDVGNGFYATTDRNAAQPSKAQLRAIRTARERYQAIAAKIEKVDGRTADKAKPDILDALKRFDSSLKGYANALPDYQTDDGVARLRKYAAKAAKAAGDLDDAMDKL